MAVALSTASFGIASLAACGTDESTDDGPNANANAEASTDGALDGSAPGDGGSLADSQASDGALVRPPPGTYMGYCTGDGGLFCDPGLTCLQQITGKDGGGFGSFCAQRICTHACDAGCEPPAIGCNKINRCEPPSCL
jgi:hypothetical protein